MFRRTPLDVDFFRGGPSFSAATWGKGGWRDCQHMAAEFVSRLTADFVRPAMAAIALTTDTSFLTAYTNDFDVDGVFARRVEAWARPAMR